MTRRVPLLSVSILICCELSRIAMVSGCSACADAVMHETAAAMNVVMIFLSISLLADCSDKFSDFLVSGASCKVDHRDVVASGLEGVEI